MTCFWKPHFSVQNHRHFSHVLRWRMAIQMKKPSSTSSTWSLGNVVDKFGHPKIRWFRFAHVCSLFTFHKLRWYTNIPQLYWSKPFPESRLFAADWGAIWFSMSRVYPPENKHGSPPCPAIFISSVGIFQTFQTRIFEQGLPIFHLFGSREFGPLGLTDLMAGWRIQIFHRGVKKWNNDESVAFETWNFGPRFWPYLLQRGQWKAPEKILILRCCWKYHSCDDIPSYPHVLPITWINGLFRSFIEAGEMSHSIP